MKRIASVLVCLLLGASYVDAQTRIPKINWLIRTNGLYDLAACPNVGIELQAESGIAFQVDYIGAWWNSDERHRYYSNYGFQTELRYYLSSRSQLNEALPYSGSHIGLYGQISTFDFEFGGTGYMNRRLDGSLGVGLSYGYTRRLNERWMLDFTVGVGFFSTDYDRYDPMDDVYGKNHYIRTQSSKLNFFGPTKLEISMVWNINHKK